MSASITTAVCSIALREDIKKEHRKAIDAARKSLEHIRRCGEMLIELKQLCPHGNFINELRLLGIEPRTGSNYMRVAAKWESVSHLRSMKDALKMLADSEDPVLRKPKLPPSPTIPTIPAKPKASGIMIDAEIIDASPPSPSVDEDEHPLVVDEVKPAKNKKSEIPSVEEIKQNHQRILGALKSSWVAAPQAIRAEFIAWVEQTKNTTCA